MVSHPYLPHPLSSHTDTPCWSTMMVSHLHLLVYHDGKSPTSPHPLSSPPSCLPHRHPMLVYHDGKSPTSPHPLSSPPSCLPHRHPMLVSHLHLPILFLPHPRVSHTDTSCWSTMMVGHPYLLHPLSSPPSMDPTQTLQGGLPSPPPPLLPVHQVATAVCHHIISCHVRHSVI